MKKILIIMSVVIIAIIANKEESIVIPESSIRFRVIANSNTLEDQTNKNKISKNLSSYIYELIKNSKSKEEAQTTINENHKNIEEYVNKYLVTNHLDNRFKLSIGRNYFPKKKYKGITYDAGYYDSIVLSLGESSGLNWWCVMYPPLCLIDEEKDDYEYTTIAQELLEKYHI